MGIAIMFFLEVDNPLLAYLSPIPMFFHLLSSSPVVEHLHKHVRETTIGKFTSSGSVFFGALMGATLGIPRGAYYRLFAFITAFLARILQGISVLVLI